MFGKIIHVVDAEACDDFYCRAFSFSSFHVNQVEKAARPVQRVQSILCGPKHHFGNAIHIRAIYLFHIFFYVLTTFQLHNIAGQ